MLVNQALMREQHLEKTTGRIRHFNVSKDLLITFATWGRELQCCKITHSCISLYCDTFLNLFQMQLGIVVCCFNSALYTNTQYHYLMLLLFPFSYNALDDPIVTSLSFEVDLDLGKIF